MDKKARTGSEQEVIDREREWLEKIYRAERNAR